MATVGVVLTVQNLSKAYGPVQALAGVSLHVGSATSEDRGLLDPRAWRGEVADLR